MSKKFSRWLRSRAGTQTLIGVAGVLVVVIVLGAVLGWWTDLIDLLSGTVAPPPPSFPPPQDGYTCFPTCDVTDGKFLSMPGEQMRSFGGQPITLWISVPGDYETFELGIFDGDSGRNDAGAFVDNDGNWDRTYTQSTYRLFTDPLRDGPTAGEIELHPGGWAGNDPNPASGPYCTASAETMPNNAWYTITCQNPEEARGPSGHYFYRLDISRPVEGPGINAFKVRSNGYLSTGQSELVDANFAIVGMLANMNDIPVLFPDFAGDVRNPGRSTYDGSWHFYFYVEPAEYPTRTVSIEIWDGDFDRGTSTSADADTDDANTEGIPPWANRFAVAERAGGQGAPADNYGHPVWRRDPPVRYTITDPSGAPIYTNEEPSGTEEWERYVITTDSALMDPGLPPNQRADKLTDELEPGWYGWHIEGLDLHNTVWIRFNYETVPQPPPPPCDATCPRTIGYWKNNVKKVLIEGKTNGVQETEESLKTALYLVAQYSSLYRHGIDVCNPQPIDTIESLTPEEAHMILQRDSKKVGYGDCDANSMLARALQQDLAAWLNWGSGKICTDSVVTLGAEAKFEGSIWGALQLAQDNIFNGTNLEQAKDIGDLINNGDMGEDADLELTTCDITDSEDSNTESYRDQFPPDLQPPKDEKKPKAPKPEPPPPPVIECTDVRTNQYNVEVTDNPFAGVKFEYTSGTEIKNGDYDEFQVTLTPEQAAALTSVQMEAKAGENVGLATLEGCQFDQLAAGETCAPVQDENGHFTFTFVGAMPNEDGSKLTLTFWVQNHTEFALSHATIGIVDGEVPDSYESKVCLD